MPSSDSRPHRLVTVPQRFRYLLLAAVLSVATMVLACTPPDDGAAPTVEGQPTQAPIMPSEEGQAVEGTAPLAPRTDRPVVVKPATDEQVAALREAEAHKRAAELGARQPVPSGDQPSIVVAQPEHDFGVATPGSKVQHRFVIGNNGPGTLEIERADGG